MGVTIKCKKTGREMYVGYFGFFKLRTKVADFLYQSDCDGKIRYGACKEILKVIGDYDDSIIYGYAGRENPTKFKDFKEILQDCVDNKCFMIWR